MYVLNARFFPNIKKLRVFFLRRNLQRKKSHKLIRRREFALFVGPTGIVFRILFQSFSSEIVLRKLLRGSQTPVGSFNTDDESPMS